MQNKKSIVEGTKRPKVDFISRRSSFVVSLKKKREYDHKITDDAFISRNIISKAGIEKILDKRSGSRPNQTAESWARARLASVIMNGKAREVDKDIREEHKR